MLTNPPEESNTESNVIAVEMYNMDKEKMMEVLDIDTLIKEKYVKPITKPETSCEYYAIGDLSVDGEVACKEHGSISNPNEKYVKKSTKPKKRNSFVLPFPFAFDL